jgi:hypothetical protein
VERAQTAVRLRGTGPDGRTSGKEKGIVQILN